MAILTKYILKYRLSDDETLLINSLTSAKDIIDNETRIKIENMENGINDIDYNDDAELFSQLKDRGYIFDSAEAEKTTIKKYEIMNEELAKRRRNTSFTICPTMGCNLRCVYCFESDNQHRDCSVMTDDQLDGIFKYITEKLSEYTDLEENHKKLLQMPTINLFGGEPLLNQNFHVVKRILEFASNNSIGVKIITNGTTIPFYAELLTQYKNSIIQIQVTVDGDEDIHNQRRIYANGKGTFDKICDNIDTILQIGIKVTLRINVDKVNISALHNLEEIIINKKWDKNSLFFPYASPVLDFCGTGTDILTEHEMLDTLLNKGYYGADDSFIKHIIACSIGFSQMFFDEKYKMKPWKMDYCEATTCSNFCFTPDGKITTCLTYVGKGNNIIGTFDKDGVNLDPENFKLWSERTIFRLDKCKECKYAFMCGGGCPVSALEQNKDIDDVVCGDIEKTLERYVYYMKDKILQSGV